MKSKSKHVNPYSFLLKICLILLLLTGMMTDKASGQLFEKKSWKGTYPDMNGSYPLAFIAYKGGVIGIPHIFIRYYPTHNYKDMVAKSVVDATEIGGKTKTDLAKTLMKIIEQSYMKGRFVETGKIKINVKEQKKIVQKIFEARFDQLGDLWELTGLFLQVYHKIDKFSEPETSAQIKELFKKEANEMFTRFLLVNLLESDHGQKINSFGSLKTEITHLLGEVDYTLKKLQYFESFGQSAQVSYSFLTQ